MTIPTVTPYTGEIANPDGSQTQTEFTQNMFDQLSFEKTFVPELNNSITEINNTATQVDTDATSAAQSASEAQAAADSVATVQFVRTRIGNISDYVGDTLTESDRFNIYQYPDGSDYWYGVKEGEAFPVTIPTDPSSDDKWSVVNAASEQWVADTVRNPNLLSNHNFLAPSPDDITHPSATPTDYVAGTQIFSGVFVDSDVAGFTYINGRVKWTGPTGAIYFSAPNTNGLEYVTEFTASVADFDGKPRTRGVSFALVGDEYRVTVGVDALEDESANETLLGSVKFEQGKVATGHELSSIGSGVIKNPIEFGCVPTTIDPLFDNTDMLISALNSGLLIDGGGMGFYCSGNVKTTRTGSITIRDLKVVTGVSALSGDAVDLSSSSDLKVNSLEIDGKWDGSNPINYSDALSNVGFKYQKADSGIARLSDISVKNWNGLAQQVDLVETVFANDIRSEKTAYGNRYTNIQSGFIGKVRAVDSRRIGFTCQSATNTTSYDDLQLSDVSVKNILPGIGVNSGDFHGIGIEIHNFVDHALATNLRAVNCHSMLLSLSGCQHGQVRNFFGKDCGYTSESDGTQWRGYAGIEFADSDYAQVEGNMMNVYTRGVRFDKSPNARYQGLLQQTTDNVSNSFGAISFQGTEPNQQNSSYSDEANITFVNESPSLLEFIQYDLNGTYENFKHDLGGARAVNAKVTLKGNTVIDGMIIEDLGTFTSGVGRVTDSLLDVTNVGVNCQFNSIKLIGVNPANLPKSLITISSSQTTHLMITGSRIQNAENIISGSTTFSLIRTYLDNNRISNVDDVYSGSLAANYHNVGSSNKVVSSAISRLPVITHGDSPTGVTLPSGSIMYKVSNVASVASPGWVTDGANWFQLAVNNT